MHANHRISAYLVHEESGTTRREFSEHHASEARAYGRVAMLEADGLTLAAAVFLVKKWNTQARAYGARFFYSLPGVPFSKVSPA